MKLLGKHEIPFPETPEEAMEWKPDVTHVALHQRVLVVANTRIEGAWCAYCSDVPGNSHYHERYEVLQYGDKVPEKLARTMFPIFEGVPYAH